MTHQDNLAAIRIACVLANPEIESETRIHVREDGLASLSERPIQLADVLLALGKFQEDEARLITITLSDENKLAISVFGDDYIEFWNLLLPLSGQSEETVAYLAGLLTDVTPKE